MSLSDGVKPLFLASSTFASSRSHSEVPLALAVLFLLLALALLAVALVLVFLGRKGLLRGLGRPELLKRPACCDGSSIRWAIVWIAWVI